MSHPPPAHIRIERSGDYVVLLHTSRDGTGCWIPLRPEHARALAEELVKVAEEIER